jgi:ketosteroid isomerase-like protein
MKKLMLTMVAVVLAATTQVNAQEVSKVKSDISDQTREEILKLNSEMESSFTSADPLKISEFYDDDATIMMNGKQVKGRKELSDFWNGIKDRKDFKLDVKELGGSGKYIYQTGNVTWTASGEQVTKSFMMVWKRLSNYEYKIYLTGLN